jgi:hypothetical protein
MRGLAQNPVRRRRAILAAVLAVLGLSAGAFAFWSTTGSGSASGTVGTLAAPSGVSASSTTGSSTVAVSWTASAPVGGVSPSGYYVKRYHDATPSIAGGDCGTPATPVNHTSCKDTEVADGTYTYAVVAVYHSWSAESARSSSVTVIGDVTPPTSTLTTSPASPEGTNGWFEKSSVSFTLSAEDAGSGVAAGSTFYTIDGGSTQTYSGAVTISSQGDHIVSYWSVDRAGNEESPHKTVHIKLDSVAPTNSLSLGAASRALLSGSTVYFNSGLSGSFTLTNTVSDTTSGPASATFPLVSAVNWTHAAETVSTPSGGPFTSSTYSWTAGAGTPAGAQATFTSADKAGNSGAGTSLTFVPDTTAPTGGAVSVNGTAASAGGSTSTSTSTSFAIGSRADYAEAQSASQSGLASSMLTIQSETLTGNTCGAPGSGGAYTSPTTISGTSNPAIATGFCYLYTLTGTDNVGNATSVATTVKVDTTGPSSPSVSLSSATGSTFISGTTVYINAQAGKEGSFKATGSSTDAETGVSTIKLPSLTGFSEGGGTLSSPFETKYKWSGAVAASGAQSATATNGFGLTTTNSSAFTVTPDTTAPSSAGTVSVPARVHATSVEVTFSGGADAGSGISASAGELLRAEATYTVSSDTCGSFGSFAKVGSAGPSSPAADATVANNKCYEYEYKAFDNVGNATTSSASAPVKVDTTAPTLTAITSTNGNGILETGDVLTLTFSESIAASSVPSSGTVTQSREGNNAAKLAITGLTGTEAWSTGDKEYEEKNTSIVFNETASISGATVKVTVGSNVSGAGNAKAGASSPVTGTVNSSVTDLAGNGASSTPFSITTKLW